MKYLVHSLSAGLVLFGNLTLQAVPVPAEPPNILFLVIDDLKPLLGCYGAKQMKTPNMDRLAERGRLFSRHYVQQALCAPSRMSMFTGLRPDTTKVWDLNTSLLDVCPSAITIQQYFKENGYTTVGCGKIMHGARKGHPLSWSEPYIATKKLPYAKGFPVPAHDGSYYQGKKEHEAYNELLATNITNWKVRWEWMEKRDAMPSMEFLDVPDDAYFDGALAKYGMGQLEKLSKAGNPFFLSIGFEKPHLPFVAPKKYWDLYSADEIQLPSYREYAKNSPKFSYQPGWELRNYTDIPPNSYPFIPIDEAKQKELIHGYYACVSYIDTQVGKVLGKLDELGLAKNTIIVLWGDHGYHLGDHSIWCKHTNFEQATHSPLIIAAPGHPHGQKAEGLVESVDIFPTLCELAGLPVPTALEGESLVPMLKDASIKVKPFSISQYPLFGRMGYALRTDRYRLVVWMKGDWRSTQPFDDSFVEATELYDYQNDPSETVSQANHPEYKDVMSDLMAQLLGFFKSTRTVHGQK